MTLYEQVELMNINSLLDDSIQLQQLSEQQLNLLIARAVQLRGKFITDQTRKLLTNSIKDPVTDS